MAFTFKNIKGISVVDLSCKLENALWKSRFRFGQIFTRAKSIEIRQIRLKQKKDYCGNHPFACPVRPGFNPPHKRTSFLEGLDWVSFNDLINDLLDELNVSADVQSSLVVIRKDERRCTKYDGHKLSNNLDSEWNKYGNYENKIGKQPTKTKFPKGTPGILGYTNSTINKLLTNYA